MTDKISNNKIFIASSSESKKFAKKVKEVLNGVGEITIWTDNFFQLSVSTFDNLCKKAINYDFAIVIYTKDDVAFIKKQACFTARDNIIFEHGLFIGILGRHKTFALIQDGVRIPTDFSGITYCKFNNLKDIKKSCEQIIETINSETKISRVSLLPSTSIALSYYNNFVKPVCESLYNQKDSIVYKNTVYNFDYNKNHLIITLPNKLYNDIKPLISYYSNKFNLNEINIKGLYRNFMALADFNNGDLCNIVDIPSVLNTSYQAIKLYIGNDFIGNTDEFETIIQKELCCFKTTLQLLIDSNPVTKLVAKISYMIENF